MADLLKIPAQHQPGHVLVVDDEPINRELLIDLMEAQGHRITEAVDGRDALDKALADPPDVVLLDVMMPHMDGYEVCRRLKEDDQTASIPVLMVTALNERAERLRGIEAGANDYLVKPIDKGDVLLRVRNAIQVKRLHDRVLQELANVRELEALRDNLMHMVVHDMRSPLMAVSGSFELLQKDLGDGNPSNAEIWCMGKSAAQELISMCNALLDVSRLEAGQMPVKHETCELHTLAAEALKSTASQAAFYEVSVYLDALPVTASVDKTLIHRVLVNLLTNAIKHTPEGGSVTVYTSASEGAAGIEVQDTGCGIPQAYHEKIFEKFGQVESWQQGEKHSSGLGLAFCKLAVEAHGGTIGVNSENGRGSTFWFTVPVDGPR